MPIHDWQKVSAGIFHDFHNSWIAELRKALNTGALPSDYYALSEQVAGDTWPDVVIMQRMEDEVYARKRNTLVIRHSSDDRVIAMIEILSPGNKASAAEFRRFLDKTVSALNQDIHLLIVDLFPPTKRDPQGIYGSIQVECESDSYQAPVDKPLTLVSYTATLDKTAYVEPIAVGDVLADMPLFLDPYTYVPIPLEATYQKAYRGVARRWREVLEH